MFLSPSELIELTNKQRRDAQVRALRFMGIQHRVRPDGTVAVLRAHVEVSLGQEQTKSCKVTEREPDWSAI